jgi:hypothetical protein
MGDNRQVTDMSGLWCGRIHASGEKYPLETLLARQGYPQMAKILRQTGSLI